MEDKKLKKMKFSEEASFLISKFLISCHEEKCGDLIGKGSAGRVLSFSDFRQAGKTELFDTLAKFAKKLGKKSIDKEAVLKYFGSRKHESKTLREIKKQGAQELRTYFMLVHLMIYVEVVKIRDDKIIGEHKFGRDSVFLEGMLPFGERVLRGQKLLYHNSLIVDTESFLDDKLEMYLQIEQKKCKHYRQSRNFFAGKTLKIPSSTAKAIRKMIRKYTENREVCLGK